VYSLPTFDTFSPARLGSERTRHSYSARVAQRVLLSQPRSLSERSHGLEWVLSRISFLQELCHCTRSSATCQGRCSKQCHCKSCCILATYYLANNRTDYAAVSAANEQVQSVVEHGSYWRKPAARVIGRPQSTPQAVQVDR